MIILRVIIGMRKKYRIRISNVAGQSVLFCCVRYKHENIIFEDLFSVDYLISITAEEIFEKLNTFFDMNKFNLPKYVGVSTDGAKTIVGTKTGLREVTPSAVGHYCTMHREALVTKRIPVEVKEALDEFEFIKCRALSARLFSQFCKEMENDHYILLMHTPVRWLSKGKSLNRFWAQRDEVRLFLL